MPDYSKTIIYKIQHQDKPELIYIGHTTNFTRRKCDHKTNTNSIKIGKQHLTLYKTIIENGGWDCFRMIQIKEFPCENMRQAEAEEDQIMKEYKTTLNEIRAFREKGEYMKEYRIDKKKEIAITSKKWYDKNRENNKEKISEARKKYYQENKERIKNRVQLYSGEKVICELCGKELCRGSLTSHNKAKH